MEPLGCLPFLKPRVSELPRLHEQIPILRVKFTDLTKCLVHVVLPNGESRLLPMSEAQLERLRGRVLIAERHGPPDYAALERLGDVRPGPLDLGPK